MAIEVIWQTISALPGETLYDVTYIHVLLKSLALFSISFELVSYEEKFSFLKLGRLKYKKAEM
jgi:hypothetical protein